MNTFRIVLIFAILFLAEYYSFVAVRSATRALPGLWRNILVWLYVVVDVLCWSGFFLIRNGMVNLPSGLKTFYIALAIGLLISKAIILIFMLGDDVRRLFMWIYAKFAAPKAAADAVSAGIPRSVFLTRLALVAGGAIIVGFIHGISNRYRYVVRRVKLKMPNLPASFSGLKIVQLSDIHTGSFDNPEAVAKGIETANSLGADIIFFTGDLVNDRSDEVTETYKKIFSKLHAPMGVYSILGNHDYGDYVTWPSAEAKEANLDRLKKIHADMGWRLMMNEHVVFEKGSDKIALIGIENWGAKAHFPKYGSMKDAYAGLPEKQVPFQILLSHDPSHWAAQVVPEYPKVDLTFSGHTHGMQFGVEIPWLKWSPVQYIYKQWAGLYKQGKQYIYVNRGFGFLGYQGRFGIMPEITLIELTS